ncbi:hypothetical protein ABZ930_36870 [Streptomyces sp. NPDC046716]
MTSESHRLLRYHKHGSELQPHLLRPGAGEEKASAARFTGWGFLDLIA